MMNTYVGTMQYMSPERLHHRPYSYSSDVWSIGLTFLQLALGRYPYSSNAPVPLILEVAQLIFTIIKLWWFTRLGSCIYEPLKGSL
jgi:serine/threonine protein kinase